MNWLQWLFFSLAVVGTAVELSPAIPTNQIKVKFGLLMVILLLLFAADRAGA